MEIDIPMTLHDIAAYWVDDSLPVLRASSSHLAVNYPFLAESGIIDPRTNTKVKGLPIGYCGEKRSGGVFYYDLSEMYRAGLIEDINSLVIGLIGNWKSSGIKAEVYLGTKIGYNHLVTDLKGEYTKLAKAVDGIVLYFGGNSTVFINLLDPLIDEDTQREAIAALAVIALKTGQAELSVIQTNVLSAAIDAAKQEVASLGERVPLLTDVVEQLFEPSQLVIDRMRRTEAEVRDMGYTLGLALQRYTTGDLRGMSHEPTTPGIFDKESPLMVMNCEGLQGQGDKAVAMITMLNFFTQSQWGRANPNLRFHKIIHDEAWELTSSPGFVSSIRRSLKLGGTWGIENKLVAHQMSDIEIAAGGELNFNADTGTKIIYKQERAQLEASREKLHLTPAEVKIIPRFKPGTALYKFGEEPGIIVEHTAASWPEIRPLVETRELLIGT